MNEFVHEWHHDGRVTTFTWLGEEHGPPDRVYALAFTDDGRMLLVGGIEPEPCFWLPGGGVEPGETPAAALRRELAEEAGATVLALVEIGAQRADDPEQDPGIHTFYWCRIRVADEFHPEHEVTERLLVSPDEYLDTLFWGRRDPKAAMLLDRAGELDRRFHSGGRSRAGGTGVDFTRRPAVEADREFVREANRLAYRDVVTRQFGEWDDEIQNAHFDDRWPRAHYEIVETEDGPVGAISTTDEGDHLWLRSVFLLPAYQRRGIGTALLGEELAQARELGKTLRLRVLRENRARALYERLGFVLRGETDTHFWMVAG